MNILGNHHSDRISDGIRVSVQLLQPHTLVEVVVEVVDECARLFSNAAEDLFPPPKADGNSGEELTDNLGPGPGQGLS